MMYIQKKGIMIDDVDGDISQKVITGNVHSIPDTYIITYDILIVQVTLHRL